MSMPAAVIWILIMSSAVIACLLPGPRPGKHSEVETQLFRHPRSGDQVACRKIKGYGELLDQRNRRIASGALEIAYISAVDAGAIGIVLLAPAMLVPQAAQVGGKALANIHTRLKTALSTIDLQTISDIPVDFSRYFRMAAVTDSRQEVSDYVFRQRRRRKQRVQAPTE
jgi:hypothetical protein